MCRKSSRSENRKQPERGRCQTVEQNYFTFAKTKNRGLHYPKLDETTLRIKAYSDAAFANNDDKRSQIGYIILLTDKNNRCHVLHYNSHKNRRVTRSILGGETCAVAEAFDSAFVLKYDLKLLLKRHIPITMYTDSKSLFDIIAKCSNTAEKRFQIDLAAVEKGYGSQEISDIAFIRSEYNPADALTKVTRSDLLENILDKNILEHPIEQWGNKNQITDKI